MGKLNSQFKRGSGMYVCACCKRNTRATGRGDNENVGICAQCYDLAGYENEIQDGYDLDQRARENIKRLVAEVIELGGKPDISMFDFIESEV